MVLVLIDVRIYMMLNYNVPNSTIYHRQLSPLPNIHNQIDGGALPLAPHHDYLHYIHHANGVKTGDITIILTFGHEEPNEAGSRLF